MIGALLALVIAVDAGTPDPWRGVVVQSWTQTAYRSSLNGAPVIWFVRWKPADYIDSFVFPDRGIWAWWVFVGTKAVNSGTVATHDEARAALVAAVAPLLRERERQYRKTGKLPAYKLLKPPKGGDL